MVVNGELFEGFSQLNHEQRLQRLLEMGALQPDDLTFLKQPQSLPLSLAEDFIENVIGYFPLPLGVAANLRIDDRDYAIPMAVEETSIIAAVSKTAKWVRKHGKITTRSEGRLAIGQIQLARLNNPTNCDNMLMRNKDYLINLANTAVADGLVKRGGGVKDIYLRQIARPDGAIMGVIHVLVDTVDAMGANIINQICEYLTDPIESLSGEHVDICILSNLNTHQITHAELIIHDIDEASGIAIQEASLFAELDPHRAATHNKGVLNGMDPIIIATGNDWRAVEAGIHAYACQSGHYRPITTWRYENKNLIGRFAAPVSVGTVGGVTKLHPTAQMALSMLHISHADELARVIAAVGLVQNLGALKALTSVGIIQGHMKLHIANLSLSAGATEAERPLLHAKLEEILSLKKRITLSNAIDSLMELRAKLPLTERVS